MIGSTSGAYPARALAKGRAVVAGKLLHAALASLRCRDLQDAHRSDEARRELALAQTSLDEVEELTLDEALRGEVNALREKLASVFPPPLATPERV